MRMATRGLKKFRRGQPVKCRTKDDTIIRGTVVYVGKGEVHVKFHDYQYNDGKFGPRALYIQALRACLSEEDDAAEYHNA